MFFVSSLFGGFLELTLSTSAMAEGSGIARMKALIIFVRLPVAGKVKARLASHVGLQAANDFYRACAEHTIRESARCEGIARFIFFAECGNQEKVQAWMDNMNQHSLEVRPQSSSSDPGQRMSDAFQAVFEWGAAQAVLISSDSPDMNAQVITDTFTSLESNDVVLGPAQDGGFSLLGLTSHHPSLFQAIPWKTDKVLQRSLDAARAENLKVSLRPTLYTMGTFEDLQEWVELPTSTHNPLYPLAANILQESISLMAALAETGYTLG